MNRRAVLVVTSVVTAGSLLTACSSKSSSSGAASSTTSSSSSSSSSSASSAPAPASSSSSSVAASTPPAAASTPPAAASTPPAAPSATAGTGGSNVTIGTDIPRADTDFWNAYIRLTPIEAKALGITNLKTTSSANDVTKLIANVSTLLSEGAKAIVMSPQDTAAIAPTLKSLADKKIPVVSIDTRPDSGGLYMVVRADNKAYGTNACQFLGAKIKGKASVVMLEGGLDSINGRDRTEAFASCMKTNFPNIKVYAEASKWMGDLAATQLATVLNQDSNVKGVYMESSFGLAGTLSDLKAKGLNVPPTDPKHVFVVSNDGIPEELKDIGLGLIDATVSQPADLYAKCGLYYAQQAAAGKTFSAGATDHDSTIIQVRAGLLEDQLKAPLVTADGGTYGGIQSLKSTDTTLWGNAK